MKSRSAAMDDFGSKTARRVLLQYAYCTSGPKPSLPFIHFLRKSNQCGYQPHHTQVSSIVYIVTSKHEMVPVPPLATVGERSKLSQNRSAIELPAVSPCCHDCDEPVKCRGQNLLHGLTVRIARYVSTCE